MGERIAGGEWIGRQAFWVDPLDAYLLGVVYALGGGVAARGPWGAWLLGVLGDLLCIIG